MKFLRTDSSHKDFVKLVILLNADLAKRDGKEHAYYAQFNKIDVLKHVLVLYEDTVAVACGAMKQFNDDCVEIKRMYTLPEYRGKGYATKILNELEVWAKDLGYKKCVLETGKRQPEAIKLYTKNGYRQTKNYGPYIGIANSVCFEKMFY